MTAHEQTKIEKVRIAIGSAAIIAAVAITAGAATLLGLAQMA